MKILQITDIEYNALREENEALKQKLLANEKKKEQRLKRTNRNQAHMPSRSAETAKIEKSIAEIDKMLSNVELELANARSMESYYNTRFVEEAAKAEKTSAYTLAKNCKMKYNGLNRRLSADKNMLLQSKAAFLKILNHTKEINQNEENP